MQFLKIFCIHKYGKMQKEPLKMVGPDILFWTYATQDGYKICEKCGKRKRYQRSGACGMGVEEPRWRRKWF